MTADAAPAKPGPRRLVAAGSRTLARFVPSARSLAIGAGIAAIGVGAYAIARETSIFAIHRVNVAGGSKAIDAQVEQALAPFVGKSLIGLDGAAVAQRVGSLSTVISVEYDRSFPNTLQVRVVPERPIAVLRDGPAAWVVSERGRVIRSVTAHAEPALPRIWESEKTVRVGEILPLSRGRSLTHALDAMRAFGPRIATAALSSGVLALHLRSGLEVIFGSPTDVALKAAVTGRILRLLPPGTRVVDVSVPSRPVTSTQ